LRVTLAVLAARNDDMLAARNDDTLTARNDATVCHFGRQLITKLILKL
jgi:hypothetical protein